MQNIISNYENLLINIPKMIKNSKFKSDLFIHELELAKATFYRKLKENRFDLQEIKKIDEILQLESEIDARLEKSENSIKKGRLVKREDAMIKKS
jgi:hypothetical protein